MPLNDYASVDDITGVLHQPDDSDCSWGWIAAAVVAAFLVGTCVGVWLN